jgi:hypothetical protein
LSNRSSAANSASALLHVGGVAKAPSRIGDRPLLTPNVVTGSITVMREGARAARAQAAVANLSAARQGIT